MNKRRRIIFLLALVAFLSSFGIADSQQSPRLNANPFRTHPSAYFGTKQTSPLGWQTPANVMISTSYISSEKLTGHLIAEVSVIPYQVVDGTVLFLGLFVNGQLQSSSNYTLSSAYRSPARMIGNIQGDWANFTNSEMTYTVGFFGITSTIPVGTIVTVTIWANNPIWVQFDSSPTTSSYETLGVLAGAPPGNLDIVTGYVAPHTVSVGVFSNAA